MKIALIDDEQTYIELFKVLLAGSFGDEDSIDYYESLEDILTVDMCKYDLILSDHMLVSESSVDVRKELDGQGYKGLFVVVSVGEPDEILRLHRDAGYKDVHVVEKGRSTKLREFLRRVSEWIQLN